MDERQLKALFTRLDSMLQGVRQYIGARYVPHFTGEYDPTQSYEALDVVDNGSGTSYIAKIPTPAGTPLTNSEYWFLYGSTSGAIVNLQQQIDDMKDINESGSLQNQIGDITDLDTDNKNNLVEAINEHDSELQSLSNQVSTNTSDISTANSNINTNTNNISAINTRVTSNESEITSLTSGLNSESTARISADTALQSQIDQLIAPTGEAPSAAEVQNARVGCEGVTYASLGASIRSQVGELRDTFKITNTLMNTTQGSGQYIDVNGDAQTVSYWNYFSVHLDDISAVYDVSGYAWYNQVQPYVFVADGTGDVMTTDYSVGATQTYYPHLKIRIPTTGTLYLNRYGTTNPQPAVVYKRTITGSKSAELLSNNLNEYLSTLLDALFTSNETPISAISTQDTAILDNNNGLPKTGGSSAYIVKKYNVLPFNKYHIKANANYANAYISIFDVNDNLIYIASDLDGGATFTDLDSDVEMPYNASYIYIAYVTSHAEGGVTHITPTSNTGEKPYSGMKWIAVGDSLTDASTLGAGNKNYVDLVHDRLGFTTYNKGQGGVGFWKGHIYNSAYYDYIPTFTEDCDIITIMGSFNDLGTEGGTSGASIIGTYTDSGTSTICGCINTTIDAAITKYPDAIIAIISPTPWSNTHTAEGAAQPTYVTRLKEICEYRSIPFIDLFHESSLRPWDATFRSTFYKDADGIHPNTNGHKRFTPRIIEFIKSILFV